VPLRPQPGAPVDQDSVAIDAQHATLDPLRTADGEVITGAYVAHVLRVPARATGVRMGPPNGP